jgi:hypothetical protein
MDSTLFAKLASVIGKLFSVLFSLILIPVLLITLLLWGLKISLLSPAFYKSTLREAQIYSRSLEELVPSFLSEMGEGGTLGPLTSEDLERVLRESISPQWLGTQVDGIIDNVFSYVSGKAPSLEAAISFGDVKGSIAENLAQVFNEKLANWPECTSGQLRQLEESEGNVLFDLQCLPPGIEAPELGEEIFAGEDGFLSAIPDQFELSEMLSGDSSQTSPLVEVARYYGYLRMGSLAGFAVLLLLVIVLILLNKNNLSGAIRWMSVPLLIAALPVLAVGVAGNQYGFGFLQQMMSTGPSMELNPVIADLMEAFVGGLFLRIAVPAGIAFAAAIVGLIAVSILKRKTRVGAAPISHSA